MRASRSPVRIASPSLPSCYPSARYPLRPEILMHARFQTVLLFGAPGAGKGTQGRILGAIPGFFHLSCGEVFRSLDMTSDLGRKFLHYSQRGELVPDDITVRMWQENMHAQT